MSGTKPYRISKQVVYQAYSMVKRNKGGYGMPFAVKLIKKQDSLL